MDKSISFPTLALGGESPRERIFIVAFVVTLHSAVLFAWMARLPGARAPEHEMEVTVAVVVTPDKQSEAPHALPPPKPAPAPQQRMETLALKPVPVEHVVKLDELPIEQQSTPALALAPAPVLVLVPAPAPAPVVAAAPAIIPSAPATPDVEPDYKAGYLNNQRPPYPFAARRMGLQGKVVLNVEVLAEGLCGQANVHQSSGHEMLDNAALQTVKTWKFIPARQAGNAITKWFKIPIQFSLNNNET